MLITITNNIKYILSNLFDGFKNERLGGVFTRNEGSFCSSELVVYMLDNVGVFLSSTFSYQNNYRNKFSS